MVMATDMLQPTRHLVETVFQIAKSLFDFTPEAVKIASNTDHAIAQGLRDVGQVNQVNRLVGALHCALSQIADFLGNNGKTASMLARAGCFDGGIQSQKLDAFTDIFNRAQNLGCAFGLGFKVLTDFFKISADRMGLGRDDFARGFLHIIGCCSAFLNLATGLFKPGTQIVRANINFAHQAVLGFTSGIGEFQQMFDIVKGSGNTAHQRVKLFSLRIAVNRLHVC